MVLEVWSRTEDLIFERLKLNSVSAAIARGKRPVSFRTRKLRLSAPMVLQGGPCGRVGHRRTYFRNGHPQGWPFLFNIEIENMEKRSPRRKASDARPASRDKKFVPKKGFDKKPNRDRRASDERRDSKSREKFPDLPEEIKAEYLHISVRAQLKTLSEENQVFVARHLQMVALLIDTDPKRAHEHALAASKKAGRIAVVRETLGVTAYTIGDYALALRELLTHRRISGSNDQLPLIVDSERGLGRPAKGLAAATDVDRSKLPVGVRINLAIALSGARLDLGQVELAKQELEIPELSPKTVFEQSPLLFRSYAEVLRELGQDGTKWEELAGRAEKALSQTEEETISLTEAQ